MNKYVRAAYCVPCGMIKMGLTKLFHFSSFSGPLISLISPYSEITLNGNAELRIGKNIKMRDGTKIRVRNGAVCHLGDNFSMNSHDVVVCHERIEIGDDVMLGPNVQIYDHDHDYRVKGGIKELKYKTSPVKIGNNVWIGAGAIILRGTTVGDNSIIAAGSIVKGCVPSNSIFMNKRDSEIREIVIEDEAI